MTTLQRAPVLFISHGAPTFALEPGVLGARLQEIGASLGSLRAVVVVSPHWQTRDLRVSITALPKTIHDFGGFDPKLYTLDYPAPGAPEIAQETISLLADAGLPAAGDAQWGLDHGAWVPMMHLLPDASVPVFQVSVPYDLSTQGALELGRALAPLRDQGVAIVGSGSMTHNLSEFRGRTNTVAPYVSEFTDWIRAAVQKRDIGALVDYRKNAPHAVRAHPTEEHFLPLHIAIGATDSGEAATVLEGQTTYGIINMESYGWGLPH